LSPAIAMNVAALAAMPSTCTTFSASKRCRFVRIAFGLEDVAARAVDEDVERLHALQLRRAPRRPSCAVTPPPVHQSSPMTS
jgi:hypothetical protein